MKQTKATATAENAVAPTVSVMSSEKGALRCKFLINEIQQNIAKAIFALKEINDDELFKFVGYRDFREFVASELRSLIPLTQALTYVAIGKKFDSESALKIFSGNIKLLTEFASDPEFENTVVGDTYVIRDGEKIPLEIFEAEVAGKYDQALRAFREREKRLKSDHKGRALLIEKKDQEIDELNRRIEELTSQVDGLVHSDKKKLAEALGTERQVKGAFELSTRKILSEMRDLECIDISKFAKSAPIREFVSAKFDELEAGLSTLKEAYSAFLYVTKK